MVLSEEGIKEMDKYFKQLKEEGFVLIYDNKIAKKFKEWLEYIEFPFGLDSNSFDWCERNRFERVVSCPNYIMK